MILKIVKAGLIPVCALLVLGGVGFGIYKGIETVSLPKCDSDYAENEVIEIFKQNNEAYQKLENFGLVKNVTMSMIVPESYDKELKKYVCTARLTVHPSQNYGLPKMYDYRPWGIFGYSWYNSASCDVTYTIYKERGEKNLKSSYCDNSLVFDYSNFNHNAPRGHNVVRLGDNPYYQ